MTPLDILQNCVYQALAVAAIHPDGRVPKHPYAVAPAILVAVIGTSLGADQDTGTRSSKHIKPFPI